LKVVPFESLDTISYSPSLVTIAVSLAISDIDHTRLTIQRQRMA